MFVIFDFFAHQLSLICKSSPEDFESMPMNTVSGCFLFLFVYFILLNIDFLCSPAYPAVPCMDQVFLKYTSAELKAFAIIPGAVF